MGHGEEVRCMQKLVGRLFITFNILFCVSNSVIAYYSLKIQVLLGDCDNICHIFLKLF